MILDTQLKIQKKLCFIDWKKVQNINLKIHETFVELYDSFENQKIDKQKILENISCKTNVKKIFPKQR